MDQMQLELLKEFVKNLKRDPDTIHLPELSFFKEWLVSLGANLPPPSKPEPTKGEPKPEPAKEPEMEAADEVSSLDQSRSPKTYIQHERMSIAPNSKNNLQEGPGRSAEDEKDERDVGTQYEDRMICDTSIQCQLTCPERTDDRSDGENKKRDVDTQCDDIVKSDMGTQCELICLKPCLSAPIGTENRRRDIETQCQNNVKSDISTQCELIPRKRSATGTQNTDHVMDKNASCVQKKRSKDTQTPLCKPIGKHTQCEIICIKRELEDEPCCRPALMIKGQERSYIKQLLSTKLKSMKIVIKQDMIDDFVEKRVPRENQSNPYTLDQRFTICLNELVNLGYLPNTIDSPTKLNEPKKRGEKRFDTDLNTKYHQIQNDLLQLLIDKNMLQLPEKTHLDKGSIKRGSKSTPDDSPSIPTGIFCDILDNCTQICFNNRFRNTDALNMCSSVFIMRLIGDMCKKNDVLKNTEYQNWKSHINVLTSFGALCCVLQLSNN